MSAEAVPAFDSRIYFGALTVGVMEANNLEADIIAQVLTGFRVRSIARFRSASEVEEYMERNLTDLVMVGGAHAKDGDADEYDLIRRLRRKKAAGAGTMPIILLTGHTSQGNVLRARDCGASFVIAKPIIPQVLYERVVWLGKDTRPFVTADTYVGPDRRFQKLGPPAGTEGRRKADLSLKVGEAKMPNLSQSEIDEMLNGKGFPR